MKGRNSSFCLVGRDGPSSAERGQSVRFNFSYSYEGDLFRSHVKKKRQPQNVEMYSFDGIDIEHYYN